MMNRWFTRYLYGIENGVEKDPKSWVVRESAAREQSTSYEDYPHPNASNVTLFPSGKGVQVGALGLESSENRGTQTLVDNFSFSGRVLAQAEWTNHRLMYATPKLLEPLHISGTAKISIRLASSKPAANLSVWLVSLPWTDSQRITDDVITRGWADPQNHQSLTESKPLVPGQFYDLTFDLQPDDQIIQAGEQIGLMIFSSDRDFTLWPEPGTELTIDLDATSITLPVVGGSDEFRKSVPQAE
jgi:X-Pro dipeptidyl-peptidase